MIKLYKTQHEYDTDEFVNGASSIGAGITVAFSGGKLVVETAQPQFVTLEACDASEGRCLVHRIREDELYSTLLSADGSALNVGDKVTINASGYATATTTGGIFEIEEFKTATQASGDVVVGKFVL